MIEFWSYYVYVWCVSWQGITYVIYKWPLGINYGGLRLWVARLLEARGSEQITRLISLIINRIYVILCLFHKWATFSYHNSYLVLILLCLIAARTNQYLSFCELQRPQAGGEHPLVHRAIGLSEAHRLRRELALRRWCAWPCPQEEHEEGTGRCRRGRGGGGLDNN